QEQQADLQEAIVAEQPLVSQDDVEDRSGQQRQEQSLLPKANPTVEQAANSPSVASTQVPNERIEIEPSHNTIPSIAYSEKPESQVEAKNLISKRGASSDVLLKKTDTETMSERPTIGASSEKEAQPLAVSEEVVKPDVASVTSMDLLPPPELSLLSPSELERAIEAGKYKEVDAPINRFSQFSFGLGARIGLLRSIRQLEARQESASDYLRAREASESQLETFELGLDAYLNHRKSGFYLRTGFNYTRTAERFEYEDIQIERDSVEGIRELQINAAGDTTPVFGQIAVTRRTEYRRKVYNSIQWLDIPLVVGYRINSNSPLTMNLEAGVHINAALRREGTILQNESGEFLDFGGNDDLFKSSIGIGFYAGFALFYEWTPGWEVGLQPNFRYYPSAISQEGYSLDQSYRMIGVNASIRISLNP
ncbi:MAG: hypothetical protein AAF990_10340, partial [Bacteroidota bacterium]